jgi:hypothetical protein
MGGRIFLAVSHEVIIFSRSLALAFTDKVLELL